MNISSVDTMGAQLVGYVVSIPGIHSNLQLRLLDVAFPEGVLHISAVGTLIASKPGNRSEHSTQWAGEIWVDSGKNGVPIESTRDGCLLERIVGGSLGVVCESTQCGKYLSQLAG